MIFEEKSMINVIKIAFVRRLSNFWFYSKWQFIKPQPLFIKYLRIYIDSRWISIVRLKFNFEPVSLKFHWETNFYFHVDVISVFVDLYGIVFTEGIKRGSGQTMPGVLWHTIIYFKEILGATKRWSYYETFS